MRDHIPVQRIRIDGGTQPRTAISESLVNDYADAMHAGTELPPVEMFFDGVDYWLADGFHRYHAAMKLGKDRLTCELHMGTRRDAVLFSCGANAGHGLRRTNEDKRKAVMTLLNDEEWSKWSNAEIARRCGVWDTTVADIKSRHFGKTDVTARTYTTKHGTEATMNVEKIGKREQQRQDYQERKSAAIEDAPISALRRLPRKRDADIIEGSMQTVQGMLGALGSVDPTLLIDDPRAEQWRQTAHDAISALRSFIRQLERKKTA